MLIFAIDTSSPHGSLSIIEQSSPDKCGNELGSKSWFRQKGHSEAVTPALRELLSELGLSTRDLDLVAVGIGPGSFTGLRVSLNLARTLAYTHNLPIIPLSSLRVLAQPALDQGHQVLTLVNAYKNMLYTAIFDPQKTVLEPTALSIEKLDQSLCAQTLTVGDGFDVYQSVMPESLIEKLSRDETFSDYPSATILGRAALTSEFYLKKMPWNQVQPLYIRASEAEEKLSKGLLKPLPKL